MSAHLAAVLLAALSTGQLSDTAAPGPKAAARPNRRIFAPENDPAVSQASQSPPLPTQPDDACLYDVSFPDPRHGWAVGDHGVILHTDDGGRRWSPQTSGVACTLKSVCFVDARIGWAAGGMAYPFLHDTTGVVLVTRDGGATWQRQPALLPAISKIRFLSERQGWAVGCSSAMYPCGVFLTRDAGRSWQPAFSGGVGGLETGDLYDGRNAILGGSRGLLAIVAAGDLARKSPGDCLDFRRAREDRSAGAGTDRGSALVNRASIARDGQTRSGEKGALQGEGPVPADPVPGHFARIANVPLRRAAILPGVHAMQVVPPSYGWLAGDGGWVALTGNGGNSWQTPLGKLPAGSAMFDFAALAVRGGRCWVAGTPGSRIFLTADAGRTWSAASTGITVPLQAIAFADDEHGWAVGQLGIILATSDGGQTWQQQRAAGSHAALMTVAGRAEDLPLELIARACKEQGYFGVAEVIGREDIEAAPGDPTPGRGEIEGPKSQREEGPHAPADAASHYHPLACASGTYGDAALPDRLRQAIVDVGGCAGEVAWGFPVRPAALQLPPQTVLESWNRCYGGRANEALLGHLVRQIRTWRPDVLLVSAGREGDGLNEIVRQSVVAAARLASDPAYLADQFRAADCPPWNVQRVYVVSDSDNTRARSTSRPPERSDSRRNPGGNPPGYPLAGRGTTSAEGETTDFAAAALRARGLLEREHRAGPIELALRPIAATDAAGSSGVEATSPGDIMAHIDIRAGGVAQRPSGGARLASAPLDALAQRRLAENLLAQLEEDPPGVVARVAKGDGLPSGLEKAEAAALIFRIAERLYHTGHWDLAEKAFAVLLDRFPDDPLTRWSIVWRLQYHAAGAGYLREGGAPENLARQIEMACPDVFAAPSIRYPLAAYYRRHEQEAQAERLYVLDHRGTDRDDWWNCARGERWLAERKGPPPRPLVGCSAASERPRLDGRLDESLWKQCVPIALSSPLNDDDAWPATVFLAHDDKFLYLAVQCRQAPAAHYEAATQRRTRDADLSQHDRVDIFLDIDRTYASYYHLTIDHRGWAADACCGDYSWDPKWFVAADAANGFWTAEAAIPLAELRTSIVPGKTVWAVGLQRTVPGVGFQSWTASAAPQVVPEGFGWVEFE